MTGPGDLDLLTFEDARRIVADEEEAVSRIGCEDSTHFYVYCGPANAVAAFEDSSLDPEGEATDYAALARFVSKATGDVEVLPMIAALDRIFTMTEIRSDV